MNYRRPPKYHHYWPMLSHMPPKKHRQGKKSDAVTWIMEQFQIDQKQALDVFSSGKQSRYLVSRDGYWQGDPLAGHRKWREGRAPAKNRQESPPAAQESAPADASESLVMQVSRIKLAISEGEWPVECSTAEAVKRSAKLSKISQEKAARVIAQAITDKVLDEAEGMVFFVP